MLNLIIIIIIIIIKNYPTPGSNLIHVSWVGPYDGLDFFNTSCRIGLKKEKTINSTQNAHPHH